MARYLVTTRRTERGSVLSARDALAAEPGVTLVNSDNPHMVTIDATEDVANRLRDKLHRTHFVEQEIRRSLN